MRKVAEFDVACQRERARVEEEKRGREEDGERMRAVVQSLKEEMKAVREEEEKRRDEGR